MGFLRVRGVLFFPLSRRNGSVRSALQTQRRSTLFLSILFNFACKDVNTILLSLHPAISPSSLISSLILTRETTRETWSGWKRDMKRMKKKTYYSISHSYETKETWKLTKKTRDQGEKICIACNISLTSPSFYHGSLSLSLIPCSTHLSPAHI